MPGEVKLPVLGKQKKGTVIAVGVAAAAVVGVAVYRSRKNKAAAAASTGAASASAAGTAADPNAVDPATGMTYAQEQASYGAAGDYYGAGGASYGGGGVSYSGSGTASTPGFTDNSQWSQYAEEYLTGLGGDPNTIGNAIGKYITGQPVTPDQQSIIQQAIAFANLPPVSGAGGFPPSIRLAAGAGPPPSPPPPPPPGKVTVPYLLGERVENAVSALASLGLHATFGTRKPHVPYHVTAASPKAGTHISPGSTVHLTIQPGKA